MATTAVYQPTASQWASAAVHFENRASWRVVRIDGVRYVVLTSGTSGHVYHVRADARGCECKWYERTGRQCSHMLSVELAALADELEQDGWSPIPEAERIAAEAWRRELAAAPEPARKRSYDDLFPDELTDAF